MIEMLAGLSVMLLMLFALTLLLIFWKPILVNAKSAFADEGIPSWMLWFTIFGFAVLILPILVNAYIDIMY